MKADTLFEALGNLDDDLIDVRRSSSSRKRSSKIIRLRKISAAACGLVILSAAVLGVYLNIQRPAKTYNASFEANMEMTRSDLTYTETETMMEGGAVMDAEENQTEDSFMASSGMASTTASAAQAPVLVTDIAEHIQDSPLEILSLKEEDLVISISGEKMMLSETEDPHLLRLMEDSDFYEEVNAASLTHPGMYHLIIGEIEQYFEIR